MMLDEFAAKTATDSSDQLRVDDWSQLEGIFHASGAVIIQGDIDQNILDSFQEELQSDAATKVPTSYPGRLRYRLGPPSECPIRGFRHMLASKKLASALDRISFHGSGSTAWTPSYCGGDEVAPLTANMQVLHSDWPDYPTSSMRLGYALCVSLALNDVPRHRAPIRFVPWSRLWRKAEYPQFGGEDVYTEGFEVTLKAGEFLIRDCRAAHGGTPNLTTSTRCLPCVQIAAATPAWNL